MTENKDTPTSTPGELQKMPTDAEVEAFAYAFWPVNAESKLRAQREDIRTALMSAALSRPAAPAEATSWSLNKALEGYEIFAAVPEVNLRFTSFEEREYFVTQLTANSIAAAPGEAERNELGYTAEEWDRQMRENAAFERAAPTEADLAYAQTSIGPILYSELLQEQFDINEQNRSAIKEARFLRYVVEDMQQYLADSSEEKSAELRDRIKRALEFPLRLDNDGPSAPPAPAVKAQTRWHLGSMNDALFIIDTPPRPSTDDVWHERSDGPSMVLNVTPLPISMAQSICDAHNAALASPSEVERLRQAERVITEIEERFPDWRSYRDLLDCIECTLHALRKGI